ncbi:MAG: hypothetical protein A3G52_00075 [Candidatus Taylorbacteria bacterium RIFCSPLOWO2_12_FULL_43_20]|uniref:riboflavin kinase n=1 Tax=Candidatus Taylorbacteria bacterium RIFCSPLOWO2_12_FULL_43_20 TaxID=1802332 RepID=A0A1G2P4G1_9BACT|nr:MAG: hypothetical protein A2825_03130 [Candidatus Taylorbacteria bacterium RIFCSPHIGHO2_01_FULL_43_120]OHA22957.1 MAG: hypothetical protein A3B98_02865 [Candidatus Taylorbacteria bacterium RIFCSPHIGHO2_02_FULL_43_55]OHA30196.1 MAG: hypothetical protein A3E92_01230 [Candidatus Taylorbacteria bacterium RIFCSPHIGHO2_12_FULL_42_34]OHA31943.1 MAG: hypothetical protein A3B09_00985 [Candidatus Taylorbacteria bacterium RIFCSPLOWO2_01_FULL_43_83]OHA37966.1 MAG: hypothetical protein A3H58_01400 [Candi
MNLLKMKIKGRVIEGKKEGKRLGFPTANIALSQNIESGVYAAKVVVEGIEYCAAVFIDEGGNTLETHILEFDHDIYGKEIEVTLGKKIRDVVLYENDKQMKKQIKQDIAQIRLNANN